MPARRVTDEQIITAMQETRSTSALAQRFGISDRAMVYRMRNLGVEPAANWKTAQQPVAPTFIREATGRLLLEVEGRAIVFSDAHFQPGVTSTANRALLQLIRDLKPRLVVCNGDALDGAGISRHSPTFGIRQVGPQQELNATFERMEEIADAAKGARLVWNLGNHDVRLHTYLATQAPELIGLTRLDIRDMFPRWEFAWSSWVNGNTVIKHRWKNSQYAPALHVQQSLGKSFVTGHLHSLKVLPKSSWSTEPTAYGVDTGMLAEPEWDAFAYREDAPADWRSGFVVLRWVDRRLLWPEICSVASEGVVDWRGELVTV